jgi:hypothetical protein
MNDKIDVLAVMDATIKLAQDGYIPEHHEVVSMESARAAIADLIEDVEDYLTDLANGLGPDPERLHAALAHAGGA